MPNVQQRHRRQSHQVRGIHRGEPGHRPPGRQKFGVSKSTVHKDVSQRLKYIDNGLYHDVKDVLAVNKAQRHIRGGIATKKKYEAMK